ncbi:hypothetical protein J6590_047901 [Homalodisca vitripennis]|nr:hypothetical protein J6590_047901 [Homalodisca vitripennis]
MLDVIADILAVPPYPTLHTGVTDATSDRTSLEVITDIPRFRPTPPCTPMLLVPPVTGPHRCDEVVDWRLMCGNQEVIADIPWFRPTPPCTPVLLVPPVTGVAGPHWCDGWQTNANNIE